MQIDRYTDRQGERDILIERERAYLCILKLPRLLHLSEKKSKKKKKVISVTNFSFSNKINRAGAQHFLQDCMCAQQTLISPCTSEESLSLLSAEKNALNPWVTSEDFNQGPVVQSIVSLTSSFVVEMLTVLVSTISNSQVFLAEKNVSSFCKCKSYSHFFQQKW